MDGVGRAAGPSWALLARKKICLSVIFFEKREICGMLFYPAWGKEPACIPALSTGVKVSERRYVQRIPGVQEHSGEGGAPTRLCSDGSCASAFLGSTQDSQTAA